MITNIKNKVKWMVCAALFTIHYPLFTSCSDFFDQESDNVVYSGEEHLNNWSDSVYSVMGILGKLQAVADRTILLGEVRGDLVTLTNKASADLRELANFNADDDNIYNQPRDYYAIINNCNYFIAHADTALKSNRNEYIFMKEYAAVKAYRAWTYLQLALNYGSVPFVDKPILTKEESEMDYEKRDLAWICEYFLNDLSTIPARYDNEYPSYGTVAYNNSRLFFFPLNVLRGDLALWLGSTMGKEAGKSYFQQAAKYYFKYISERNGTNTSYPTGLTMYLWSPGTTSWLSPSSINEFSFADETYSTTGFSSEYITIIPGDSARVDGNYSELRNLFNSTSDNDYEYSITPSRRMEEISESQMNCVLSTNGVDVTYAPTELSSHLSGDLRLHENWNTQYATNLTLGTRVELQTIYKYLTKNIHINRRMSLYLRLAEALNLAGQPRLAFAILERGLSEKVLREDVYRYTNKADSTWIVDNFGVDKDEDGQWVCFPAANYGTLEAEDIINGYSTLRNMLGIHTRGSGWSPLNKYYKLDFQDSVTVDAIMQPDSTFIYNFNETAYQAIKKRQQEQVDSLLLNEEALELCFEGYRYYDLMRFAMRADLPGQFLTKYVNSRNGQGTNAGIDLTNRQSWYLRWGNGKVGY